MSSDLVKLLVAVVISMVLGYLFAPAVNMLTPDAPVPSESAGASALNQVSQSSSTATEESGASTGGAPVVVHTTPMGDSVSTSEMDSKDGLADDGDEEWEDGDEGEDWTVARDADSYTPQPAPVAPLKPIREADIPVVPAEQAVPAATSNATAAALHRKAENLAEFYEKEEKKRKDNPGYISKTYTAEHWNRPEQIYRELLEKTLPVLASPESAFKALRDPETRLNLARLTLIRKVGYEKLAKLREMKMGINFLHALTSDEEWMTGLLYSGPTERLDVALRYLAVIYASYAEQMTHPHTKRIATTTALEFAREGWSEQDMTERFAYYYKSYETGKLNRIFNTLRYWETRIVTGCTEPGGWGSARSLAWQRDNVRLPVEGYLSACNQLVYRLRNVAGDSVFSEDYLAPILSYTNNTTAWAHREIGGVCGACSHYGAYAALAAGIPAMTMGEPGHCAYAVRVGNEWKMSYSIYWQHGMHKTFWGQHDWDFLILTQDLYTDYHRTLVSDQLLAIAELLASRRMMKSAFLSYDAAVSAQPLNWPAWVSYTAYLKHKAPDNKARWKSLHDRVVEGLAVKFHNVAAVMLSSYVYPHLLPLTKDARERNKMYEAFFDCCDGFGTNRWDLAPLLTTQIKACASSKEKLAFLKDALKTLMSKPDYAGAVLSWGLDYMAGLPESDPETEKLQEEFSDLIVRALNRARTGKGESDATWAALGEAIYAAASNNDKRTFQAIGKLAHRKCRKNFPKVDMAFRAFPGRVVSAKGLIRSATTVDPGQMSQSCLHWGVLQKHGGSIPAKFEGEAGMTLELESYSRLNGVVCVFAEPVKSDRDFKLEVSSDGRNWVDSEAVPAIQGKVIRVDLKKLKLQTRFVRLLRDGDKWESTIVGFYVYGRPVREK